MQPAQFLRALSVAGESLTTGLALQRWFAKQAELFNYSATAVKHVPRPSGRNEAVPVHASGPSRLVARNNVLYSQPDSPGFDQFWQRRERQPPVVTSYGPWSTDMQRWSDPRQPQAIPKPPAPPQPPALPRPPATPMAPSLASR